MKTRKCNRLKDYDYSEEGCYFVTICTNDKVNYFGEIQNAGMILNEYGKIAFNMWAGLPNVFKNIELDEFVVMPNHIHGIIIINNNVGNAYPVPENESNSIVGDASSGLITNNQFLINGEENPEGKTNPQMRPVQENFKKYDRTKMQLSKIIHAYKSETTRRIKRISKIKSVWQRSYYDHIIRNEKSLENIRVYIHYNALKWEWDAENKLNENPDKNYYIKLYN